MRRRRRGARPPATAANRLGVTFTGFGDGLPDLYEFKTLEGHYIYLHEMDCVNIQFSPIDRHLDLTFECVASDIMKYPLSLALRFGDARIHEWLDDEAGSSEPPSPLPQDRFRGQIAGLAQIEDGLFCLTLLDVTVNFTASSVECFVTPDSAQTS